MHTLDKYDLPPIPVNISIIIIRSSLLSDGLRKQGVGRSVGLKANAKVQPI
ncbi:uncharacterized protein LACBIDRAFT_314688 [Laccaria bicolor S238N-H82]|uniref:Predicted protein n=1 Tax=Laccaria bicolor (strain S238N-H82 / ATCC MYA-4686) TaxID=486041 RepID=B0DZ12_LACBS|nr:uncharacterized protein LACBIDRAFT_314688 [Laccaria bicolor S238N-H82]EDR00151.1 predicted protein [Laccaria bicolor S238N-H82]|eukprot:XP_001889208.1 predicted protein [Laccaria bicolor S238N-H82]